MTYIRHDEAIIAKTLERIYEYGEADQLVYAQAIADALEAIDSPIVAPQERPDG